MTFDGSTVKWYKDNSLIHTVGSIPSAEYSVGLALYDTDESAILNFGQDPTFAGVQDSSTSAKTPSNSGAGTADSEDNGKFFYAPPSGFLALCSANLPEPTIGPNSDTQADDNFNTHIYDGNNNATRTFDVGFVSDWSWFKARSGDGYGHQLYDSPRGVQKYLRSNGSGTDTVAGDVANAEGLTSFDSSGDLAIGTDAFINEADTTMVIWNWKAGGTPTADNTASAGATPTAGSVKIDGANKGDALAGSIAATRLSASTKAGFSIVTYTGTGSNATVGHGLDNAPEVLLVKSRETSTYWMVYHIGLGANTSYMSLNTNLAVDTGGASVWNSTTPSNSVFSIGTSSFVNPSSDMVAYCFHSVEGYSKFGSYTGNNKSDGADGTFVYLGFRPAWIMIKRSNATEHWHILDNKRDPFNGVDNELWASLANEESSGTERGDFLSNGFKIRGNNAGYNTSHNYIYMAFAEAPFKYANAR